MPEHDNQLEEHETADFRKSLLNWYQAHKRDLPWRNSSDPWHIWVSEIMLQQTRVDQAIPYYYRFLEAFPDIKSLAEADRQEVLRIWEGLGYYSRARNMQDAARQIMDEFGGDFPDTYNNIRSLKGIGPYTAAAISSIVFGLPHAVVDGNVIRVLTRWAGISGDVRKTLTLHQIQALADDLLDQKKPGDFNQALMELGAVICTPKNPSCTECPLFHSCVAFKNLQTEQIPYKSPAKKTPHHNIVVGVCQDEQNRILIALRPEDKMLGGLWEFPGGKMEKGEIEFQTLKREFREELGVEIEIGEKITEIRHTYSHFKITLHAWWCTITRGKPTPNAARTLKWISVDELKDHPFPKANRKLTESLTSAR